MVAASPTADQMPVAAVVDGAAPIDWRIDGTTGLDMTIRTLLAVAFLVAHPAAYAQTADDEALADQAVLALPAPMRADATVVRFIDGEEVVLRSGKDEIFCRADDPETSGVNVWCYPRSHAAYARRWFALAATGLPASEVNDRIVAEIEAEELEWPALAVNYNLRGPSADTATLNTVVYMPYATGESIGLTEDRQYDRPWLMYSGTAFAHVMIPGQ